jgi:hypothetical protein
MEPTTRAIRHDELLAQMGWVRELARGLVSDPSLADDLAQETGLAAGHHRFDLLPQAPGELQVILGGVTYTSPIGANEASTRFTLPPTGRLEIAVDTATLPIGGRTCVVLQALEREGQVDRTYFAGGEAGLVPRTFSLAQGRYRVQLEHRRLGGPGGTKITPVGEPREVSVTAGRTLSLTLP